MDDYPGQPQAPGTPPPPTYQAPPPSYQPPQAPPAADYAPQAGYAPPAAPPKKKTWLWIVIGLVVLGLLGCCGAMALGGFALFSAAGEPSDSIDAINQAALDGDTPTFEKYFDVESVTQAAHSDFLDYVKTTEDWTTLVAEVGEEEADRLLREEIMPEATFVEEFAAEFSLDTLAEGEVPFPEYTVTSTSIENDTAELALTTIEEGEEIPYVLGMVKEQVGDESIWVIKEIKNIAERLSEEATAE